METEIEKLDFSIGFMYVLHKVFKYISLLSVALPCGHRMPTDYVVAWFKCYLKQVCLYYTVYILTAFNAYATILCSTGSCLSEKDGIFLPSRSCSGEILQ